MTPRTVDPASISVHSHGTPSDESRGLCGAEADSESDWSTRATPPGWIQTSDAASARCTPGDAAGLNTAARLEKSKTAGLGTWYSVATPFFDRAASTFISSFSPELANHLFPAHEASTPAFTGVVCQVLAGRAAASSPIEPVCPARALAWWRELEAKQHAETKKLRGRTHRCKGGLAVADVLGVHPQQACCSACERRSSEFQ